MKMNRTAMTACVLAGLFAAPSAGIAAEEAAKEEDWRQAFEAHKLETQAALIAIHLSYAKRKRFLSSSGTFPAKGRSVSVP